MNKYLVLTLLVLMVLPLGMVSAAENIVGTHQIVLTMGPWETLQGVSIDPDNRIAYITLSSGEYTEGNPVVTTTAIPENFEYAPTIVTQLIIIENSTTMDPSLYTIAVDVSDTIMKYDIQLPTTQSIIYSTMTTVITNVISIPTTTVRTLSWQVYYPIYAVEPVNINIHENGYFLGLSIGYYTLTTDPMGNVSTIFVPTVPAERNITIIWDPIDKKIITGKITISDMRVLPTVEVQSALGTTYFVTRNATIIIMTVGEFGTQTDIMLTRDGLNSYAVFVIYKNGVPEYTTYAMPDVMRALIDYMQLIKYGKETIQWQGDGANAKPIIIVPYTAVFITDTYTGNMTIHFDDTGQEYIIFNAMYTRTILDDFMGVFTGAFNFTLSPGQWVGGVRNISPVTTTYTDVVLVTKTEYTTTTFVVPANT